MPAYYLDTSAAVKRYAQEPGTTWIFSLTDPTAGHDIFTVRLTGPEMIAALFRKARTGEISRADAAHAAPDFQLDWQQQYRIIEVTVPVTEQAMALATAYGLRGYDAVHLAATLGVHRLRRANGLPGHIFVPADLQQLRAAASVGMPVEDPNQHA